MDTVRFAINEYDRDGYQYGKCIKIYINECAVLLFNNISELETFHNDIGKCIKEMLENFPELKQ